MTVFDIACDDAILTKDDSFLRELRNIKKGTYDTIDNQIDSIDEVVALIKKGKTVYYKTGNGEVKKVVGNILEMSKNEGYRCNIDKNIKAGNIIFLRKNTKGC